MNQIGNHIFSYFADKGDVAQRAQARRAWVRRETFETHSIMACSSYCGRMRRSSITDYVFESAKKSTITFSSVLSKSLYSLKQPSIF